LLIYNLKDLDRSPQESAVDLGWPQEFDYDSSKQELYVVNHDTQTLLFLNAATLAVTKSVNGLNLSDGDTVVVHDNNTDSVIVAAEGTWPLREPDADDAAKSPVVVVDRSAGQMRYQIRWCEGWCNPGFIVMHPNKAIIYLGFTDTNLAYNTEMRRIVARSPAGYRWMSNLAMTPDGAELLVSAPAYSAVLRFDAASLQYKGRISSVLGVRALGVDSERNLLLAGSLSNNMLDVIDLKTNTRVAQYWIGPWLRKISVDSKRGFAIVSSIEGLFRVNYLSRIAGSDPHRLSRQ
jgi:DNA-binding beta-propeller fold protein YncE